LFFIFDGFLVKNGIGEQTDHTQIMVLKF